jgi:hypothetical protein
MSNLKNMSFRFLVINILKKVIAILGYLLLVFSLVSPFYLSQGRISPGRSYLWSYRGEDYPPVLDPLYQYPMQSWFFNYWFGNSDLSWILLSMFTIQVLALVFGIASIIFNRRILSFVLVLLCLGVLGLMISGGQTMVGEYQLGYYLVTLLHQLTVGSRPQTVSNLFFLLSCVLSLERV